MTAPRWFRRTAARQVAVLLATMAVAVVWFELDRERAWFILALGLVAQLGLALANWLAREPASPATDPFLTKPYTVPAEPTECAHVNTRRYTNGLYCMDCGKLLEGQP